MEKIALGFTCFAVMFSFILCDAPKDGREIVMKLLENPTKCKEPVGGSWVPLPEGLKCGSITCDYPKEWCVIKSKDGVPDLFCHKLDPACQDAVKKNSKDATAGKPKAAAKVIKSTTDDEEEEAVQPSSSRRPQGKKIDAEDAPGSKALAAIESKQACQDSNDICCFWAARGECDSNAIFMKRACKKSCGTCDCSLPAAESCPTSLDIDECRWLPAGFLPPKPNGQASNGGRQKVQVQVAGSQQPAPTTGQNRNNANCRDKEQFCPMWAKNQHCQTNRIFMIITCPLSCKFC